MVFLQNRDEFHCFSCGETGNSDDFALKYEEQVLGNYGVRQKIYEDNRESRKDLLDINKVAALYFHHSLTQNKHAYKYFSDRGLSDDTIRKFGLGYAAPNSFELTNRLRKQFSLNSIKESGLVSVKEYGSNEKLYNKFFDRVMFPIMDVDGKVIGFGGRILNDEINKDEKKSPKYINSPESPIFEKRRTLYGLHIAKNTSRKEMILCEGYMDVIAMHQGGFDNAVAALGTSLTKQHAALLKQYTDSVVLSMDSDEAGIKARLRAIPILKNAGLEVRVIDMSPYKDPDEFIKKKGSEEFNIRLEYAEISYLYELRILRNQSKDFTKDFANLLATKSVDEMNMYAKAYKELLNEESFIETETFETEKAIEENTMTDEEIADSIDSNDEIYNDYITVDELGFDLEEIELY
jgi:DNA primase